MTDHVICRPGPLSLATLILLLFVWGANAKAQPATPPPGRNDVLLEVGREKFTAEQIAAAFSRNANRGARTFWELERDSALAFINLFANYRLKVQAALDAGVDRRPEVIEDIRNNRQQLAVPPPPQSGICWNGKLSTRRLNGSSNAATTRFSLPSSTRPAMHRIQPIRCGPIGAY